MQVFKSLLTEKCFIFSDQNVIITLPVCVCVCFKIYKYNIQCSSEKLNIGNGKSKCGFRQSRCR